MRFRSATERRWWTAAAATLAAVYAALYPSQLLLDALRERNLLRKSLLALALAAAGAVALWLARRGAGRREWLTAVLIAAVYAAVASRLTIVQERIHLVQYGAVALLFLAALEARAAAGGAPPGGRAALGAALLTAAAGWLDEGIQGLLPNRHYDLRDVGTNALAGGLALGAVAALRAARRSDLAAAGADS